MARISPARCRPWLTAKASTLPARRLRCTPPGISSVRRRLRSKLMGCAWSPPATIKMPPNRPPNQPLIQLARRSSSYAVTFSSPRRHSRFRYSVMASRAPRSASFCIRLRCFPNVRTSSAPIRSARRDGENHKLLRSARHCAWRVAARARRHQGQSRRHDHDLPAFGVKRSVDAALSRPRCRFRLGLDAGARPRPPAGRRVAAGDLRPCRLGWTDRHHRGDRRGGDLGHPWPGGCADPLVRLARVEGAAARHRRLRRRGRRRRRRSHTMNRFAELLDRLAYEPSRNSKLRLMIDYFRSTGDPERGWALAALTGGLSFPHAKAGLIRSLIAERTDPVLFELSYDYVGDLSETVALMWPRATPNRRPAVADLPLSGGSDNSSDAEQSTEKDDLTLTRVVETLVR